MKKNEQVKIDKPNYLLRINKLDIFKSNLITFNFIVPANKENNTFYQLLVKLMYFGSLKYPSKKDLNQAVEELYDIDIWSNIENVGTVNIVSFCLKFINPKYTDFQILPQILDFFTSFIYEPNVKDNAFLDKNFNLAKEELSNRIKGENDDPMEYSEMRFFETAYPNSSLGLRAAYQDILDTINSKNLYQKYLELIKDTPLIITAVGDLDESLIASWCENVVKSKDNIKDLKNVYIDNESFDETPIEYKETKPNLNQSKLLIGWQVKDLSEREKKYVCPLVTAILGNGSQGKLFRIVREKHSLAYYAKSDLLHASNFIKAKAGINVKNYEKTKELIVKCANDIANGDFSIKELQEHQKAWLVSMLRSLDNIMGISNIEIKQIVLNDDNPIEQVQIIPTVTKEEVINVAKKMQLKAIYLLSGGETDEEN